MMNAITVKTTFVIFIILLLNQSLLCAEWEIKREVDSMTDEEKISAVLFNGEGYKLKLYTLDSGEFFCTFSLPADSLDVLSHSQSPIYRVDKNEPCDLNLQAKWQKKLNEMGIETKMYQQEPKWCNFNLSRKLDKVEDIGGALEEFAKGERIVFRYWLFTGGYKETSFIISGADKVISEVLKARINSR